MREKKTLAPTHYLCIQLTTALSTYIVSPGDNDWTFNSIFKKYIIFHFPHWEPIPTLNANLTTYLKALFTPQS